MQSKQEIKSTIKERIILLREELNKANQAYFTENKEIIPEEIRDSLKKELIKLETENPEFFDANSPTQRIWSKLDWYLAKITHKKKKESLSDVFSFEEIEEWIERISKDLPWWKEKILEDWLICELKIDGLNITLSYENWVLKKAATRWDGFVWEDITHNAKTIFDIPLEIKNKNIENKNGTMQSFPTDWFTWEIWWEIFMTKKSFEETKSKEEVEFKNPRNCAAWTIRQLDPELTSRRKLNFFPYFLESENNFYELQKNILEEIKNFWFPIEKHFLETKNLEEIKKFLKTWEEKRNDLDYEIDWIVIKVNDKKVQERLWSTAKSPRRAVAYKFPASVAQSKILEIHHQIWRTWVITPVAIMEPFELLGSTISRATLHNFDEIEKLDVRIWDTAIIEKAWDIIPKIKSIIPELRPEKTEKIFPPKNCPVCDSEVKRIEWEVAYKCENLNCWTRHLRSLTHFTSRDWLNIDWLWEKVLDLLIENKIIEDFWDIFSIQEWDLIWLPLFKDKKIKNLLKSIEESKTPQISKFFFALWIPFIWKESADILWNFVSKNLKPEVKKIKNWSPGTSFEKSITNQISFIDDIIEVPGLVLEKEIKILKISQIIEKILEKWEEISYLEWIWEKIFYSIEKFFTEEKNLKILEKLEINWLNPKPEEIKNNLEQIFEWKIFVLTWALEKFSREDAKKIIKERWWKVSSSVSKNTNFLLAWENTWEKFEKANRIWVEILDEKNFLEKIN